MRRYYKEGIATLSLIILMRLFIEYNLTQLNFLSLVILFVLGLSIKNDFVIKK